MTTGRPVFPSYFVDDSGNPQEGVEVSIYIADPDVAFDDLDPETIATVLDLATVYTDETGDTDGDNPFVTSDGNVWPFVDIGDYVAEANGALLRFSSVPPTAGVGDVTQADLDDALEAEATARAAAIAALSDTYVGIPDPIGDGQVPAWDQGTETWVAVDPGTGGSGGGSTGGFLSTAKWGTD